MSRPGRRRRFSHQGKFWRFNDIAIWPRPYQQPHPPVWVPFTGSKETIEWAGKHGLNAVFPDFGAGSPRTSYATLRQSLAKHGHRISSDRLCLFTDAWVAESKAKALEEYAPYYLYFTQVLWHHGSLDKDGKGGGGPPPSATSFDYVRPENRPFAELDRAKIRQMNLADVEKRVHVERSSPGVPRRR